MLRDFSQFGTGNLPKLRPISIRIANDLRPLVFMPFERLHGCLLHSRPALRPVAACAGIRIFIALAPLRSTIVIVGFLPACHKPPPGIVDKAASTPGSRRTASVRANRPAASSKNSVDRPTCRITLVFEFLRGDPGYGTISQRCRPPCLRIPSIQKHRIRPKKVRLAMPPGVRTISTPANHRDNDG